jgi:hypothetical protein
MRSKEYECKHWIVGTQSIDLMVRESTRVKMYIKCHTLIEWWDITTNKIMPIRRTWTEEEHLATR